MGPTEKGVSQRSFAYYYQQPENILEQYNMFMLWLCLRMSVLADLWLYAGETRARRRVSEVSIMTRKSRHGSERRAKSSCGPGPAPGGGGVGRANAVDLYRWAVAIGGEVRLRVICTK